MDRVMISPGIVFVSLGVYRIQLRIGLGIDIEICLFKATDIRHAFIQVLGVGAHYVNQVCLLAGADVKAFGLSFLGFRFHFLLQVKHGRELLMNDDSYVVSLQLRGTDQTGLAMQTVSMSYRRIESQVLTNAVEKGAN